MKIFVENEFKENENDEYREVTIEELELLTIKTEYPENFEVDRVDSENNSIYLSLFSHWG